MLEDQVFEEFSRALLVLRRRRQNHRDWLSAVTSAPISIPMSPPRGSRSVNFDRRSIANHNHKSPIAPGELGQMLAKWDERKR